MSLVVKEDQNIIDVVIARWGDSWPQGLVQLIDANEISPTDDLVTGQSLEIDDFEIDSTMVIGDQGFTQSYQSIPKSVSVGEQQNPVDVALSEYGSQWSEGLIDMLSENDIELLNKELTPGQELKINPDTDDLTRRQYKSTLYKVSTKNTIGFLQDPEANYYILPGGGRIIFE
ncbi:MAG: hypothetical protein CMJ19_07520 [Phycisphaeraceae bacterium]|nr:hypothetical protein [Phycisphaeraceae bacterium]